MLSDLLFALGLSARVLAVNEDLDWAVSLILKRLDQSPAKGVLIEAVEDDFRHSGQRKKIYEKGTFKNYADKTR